MVLCMASTNERCRAPFYLILSVVEGLVVAMQRNPNH
jgi:hypothetical protein